MTRWPSGRTQYTLWHLWLTSCPLCANWPDLYHMNRACTNTALFGAPRASAATVLIGSLEGMWRTMLRCLMPLGTVQQSDRANVAGAPLTGSASHAPTSYLCSTPTQHVVSEAAAHKEERVESRQYGSGEECVRGLQWWCRGAVLCVPDHLREGEVEQVQQVLVGELAHRHLASGQWRQRLRVNEQLLVLLRSSTGRLVSAHGRCCRGGRASCSERSCSVASERCKVLLLSGCGCAAPVQ